LLLATVATAAFPFIGGGLARTQAGGVAGAGSALLRAVYQKWIELAVPAPT
jgi:hypothetical protein